MQTLVQRLLGFLLYGGTSNLRPFERQIVERAASSLPDSDKASLLVQLEQIMGVQRFLKGRPVNIYVTRQGVPSLMNTSDTTVLARLRLRAQEVEVTVAIVTYQGYLSSLEFSKPPRAFSRIPFVVVAALPVAPHVSPAAAADRQEHGRG